MTLDEKLKEAGLLTVDELMKGQPMDGFIAHAGVNDLATFVEWLDMRSKEMLRMKARMTLNKMEDDEMFEWIVSHCAAFNEVRINLRQALNET